MNLQKIVILCVILVAVGGGAWYVLENRGDQSGQIEKSATEETNQDFNSLEATDNDLSGFGSFTSLLGLGQNVTCDYSFSDADGNSGSGSGYFADGRMRVDSVMSSDGQTFDSHMINDGESIYTWTTGGEEEFAIKMAVPEEGVAVTHDSGPDLESERGMVDANQEVEYKCDRWRVDASVFIPPSDVKFMDMASMMNEMMQGLPEGFTMPEGFPISQ